MADDDSGSLVSVPAAADSGAGVSAPAAPQESLVTPPRAQADAKPENKDITLNEAESDKDDDDEPQTPPSYYKNMNFIDLLVGITPDKLINTIAFKAEALAEDGFLGAAGMVNKALFAKGDEGGDPRSLPHNAGGKKGDRQV
ncbi:MAG: hypothetical protein K2Q01_07885 [Rickettsiales bacterium]|nr:hypothetical protein [Rickettsiales bacterium]